MNADRTRKDLQACYTNSRTALKLTADFSQRWEFREKTFGYVSARIKVPYKQGADFYVHANLIAQPATRAAEASIPPDIVFEEDDGPFRYEIRERKLTATIPLDQPGLWGTVKSGSKPLLYVDRSMATSPLCRWRENIWLDLRIWITSESDQVPVPSQYERGDGLTVSGGQFESNRRRH